MRDFGKGVCVGGVLLVFVVLVACEQGAEAGEAADARAPETSQGMFAYTRAMSGTHLETSGDRTQVSFVHGDYVRPRLLPGRDQVLLNSRRGGRLGIWIEDIKGDGREKICDGDQVSVSPDGKAILFRRGGAIVRRELSSGAEQVLSPSGWPSCSHPGFCADGQVLFVSAGQGKDGVYLADSRETGSPQLLFDGEIGSGPRCSPDGGTIAYQNGAHIYLFDVSARSHHRLTFAGGVQSWPMWGRDSQSIAYLQSPTRVDGPWHVCNVRLDNPRQVSVVLRDVEPGPDWNGLGFSEGVASTLQGDEVSFWRREKPVRFPIEVEELSNAGDGWGRLPADRQTAAGDLLVECEWGGLCLSATTGSAFLLAKHDGALGQAAEVCLLDGQGKQARQVQSVTLAEPGVDEVSIQAVLHSADGPAIKAAFSISRTRPLVELEPVENLGGALVRKPLELALVPDRLANDLIYDPSEYESPVVALPRSPFALGLAADKSLLMLVTPSREQTMQLVRDEGEDVFLGVQAQCGGESLFISVLPGDGLWRTTQLKPGEGDEPWQVTWSNPFPAQWRLATQARDYSFALVRMVDSPLSEKPVPLAEIGKLTAAPRRSIIYVYGRSQNTPLHRMMPTDIVQDALGLAGASALLDTAGIRTYRHAEQWVPYKDPRVALKILRWIRKRDRPGVQEKIDAVCSDILLSLRGLDSRTKEYEAFAGELTRISEQEAASAPAKALLEFVQRSVAQLDENATPPLSDVEDKIKAFRRNDKEGHKALSAVVLPALSKRLEVLVAYRHLARRVRDEAGLTMARSPESRGVCEAVRELAGRVLRNRYYLEADWRGERPLGEPEVSYEKVADL